MLGLQTKNLSIQYGDYQVIQDLSFQIPAGKITVLVGANGSGKSTLLRSLARLLKPQTGDILIDEQELQTLSSKEIAKQLAILPQGPLTPEGITVHQLVKQGRYPHQRWFQQWSEKDEDIVEKAIVATQLHLHKDRAVDSLSGGQRQRAWIAMTLAQETPIMLLDEPTTYLDMTHQIEVLDFLFELNRSDQRTIVMVLHDLNLACRYADHLVAIHDQTVAVQGPPEDIVTVEMVQEVFGMEVAVSEDPFFGTPLCIPKGKGRYVK
ncbi:ABC transporter ATP-binding protein [Lysinibacillus sphaericus]|uniref:Iron compound ABC transporter ATP-binding protein n=1 Tax=Lysinibacillus sphaericus OT4b.31 TaxID=1285586 RepID=R7ZBC6_LYSSH|nr:ABC transporter ATP-binding protein [Lysinibacillus sphaericus]EON71324.1 iron compound ABC transporter ATP-binding protein [Lysinibacillus sphaericus OT4b.31]